MACESGTEGGGGLQGGAATTVVIAPSAGTVCASGIIKPSSWARTLKNKALPQKQQHFSQANALKMPFIFMTTQTSTQISFQHV